MKSARLSTLCSPESVRTEMVSFSASLSPSDEHIRDLLTLRFADLVADLLVAQVGLDAQPGLLQTVGDSCLAYSCGAVGDGQDLDLHRREPQRERAGIVLGEDADEALDRAEAPRGGS